ncbi:hypothetical protein E4H12_01895 [Candidatus Thorarchaeota archaeon]|nr:MAG: hypothetical protein E4H12_01895 [Candidatus Thorarchaeota archaeon]
MKIDFRLKAKVFKIGNEYSAQLIDVWMAPGNHIDCDYVLFNSKEWVGSEREALANLVLYDPHDSALLYEAKQMAFQLLKNDLLIIERVWY